MPVQWTISHPNRLVIAVAKGEIVLGDVEAYFDGVTAAHGWSYRKIFDMSNAVVAFGDDETLLLAARIKAYMTLGPLGPLAFVATSGHNRQSARLFAMLGEGDRQIGLFRELHMARRWLDGVTGDLPGS